MRSTAWSEPAGGGAVAARQIALLAGRCEFFTALGDDEIARRRARGGWPSSASTCTSRPWPGSTSRRAWTHVDAAGERTITLLSEKLHPHGPLPLGGYDAVFFTAGDAAALHSARKARFLAATPRESATLREAGVPARPAGRQPQRPRRADRRRASRRRSSCRPTAPRGCIANGERFPAVPPPGPVVDTYGAGDSFAAALCFALARGDALPAAIELASRAGAAVITGEGPYTTQLTLTE